YRYAAILLSDVEFAALRGTPDTCASEPRPFGTGIEPAIRPLANRERDRFRNGHDTRSPGTVETVEGDLDHGLGHSQGQNTRSCCYRFKASKSESAHS